MSRFEYVKYDEIAARHQSDVKDHFVAIEMVIDTYLNNGRAKALVMTHIEEAYMWVGKAIRDDQIERNKKTELQEERNNS